MEDIMRQHVAQILGYLRSSRVEHGLLINFGAPKFEIKKYALSRIGEASRPGGLIGGTLSLFASLAFSRLFQFRFLTRWILSWMPHVQVLAPRQLRERVRERMRQGLARCG